MRFIPRASENLVLDSGKGDVWWDFHSGVVQAPDTAREDVLVSVLSLTHMMEQTLNTRTCLGKHGVCDAHRSHKSAVAVTTNSSIHIPKKPSYNSELATWYGEDSLFVRDPVYLRCLTSIPKRQTYSQKYCISHLAIHRR